MLFRSGERIYEESLGYKRTQVEQVLRRFEHALDSYDQEQIAQTKQELIEFLETLDEWE